MGPLDKSLLKHFPAALLGQFCEKCIPHQAVCGHTWPQRKVVGGLGKGGDDGAFRDDSPHLGQLCRALLYAGRKQRKTLGDGLAHTVFGIRSGARGLMVQVFKGLEDGWGEGAQGGGKGNVQLLDGFHCPRVFAFCLEDGCQCCPELMETALHCVCALHVVHDHAIHLEHPSNEGGHRRSGCRHLFVEKLVHHLGCAIEVLLLVVDGEPVFFSIVSSGQRGWLVGGGGWVGIGDTT